MESFVDELAKFERKNHQPFQHKYNGHIILESTLIVSIFFFTLAPLSNRYKISEWPAMQNREN